MESTQDKITMRKLPATIAKKRAQVVQKTEGVATHVDGGCVPPPPIREAEMAMFTLDPAMCGITVVQAFDGKFGTQHITALLVELDGQIQRLRAGDMSAVEAMLFAQATALQAIFVDLATRAQRQEQLPLMQTQLAMALKAQAQCRATLEALAEVKNPRQPTFVRNQNVTQQQVVNNAVGIACGREHIEIQTNKLIREPCHASLDPRGTGTAVGVDSALEAMVAVDGADNVRGKGES